MRDNLNVSVSLDEFERYGGGLKGALERALEKMTESSYIKPVAKLLMRLTEQAEQMHETNRRKVELADIRRDMKHTQERLEALERDE